VAHSRQTYLFGGSWLSRELAVATLAAWLKPKPKRFKRKVWGNSSRYFAPSN